MKESNRRSPRKALQVDIRAKDAEGDGTLQFEASNLSAGGAFLKSDLLLEQGEALTLEFRVPGIPRLLRAPARVAWVRRFPEEGEQPGMGVEFLSMADEDRSALERFLAG